MMHATHTNTEYTLPHSCSKAGYLSTNTPTDRQRTCVRPTFFTLCRIPSKGESETSEIKQVGERCMDTLGHSSGESIGLFKCHKSGGNQVCTGTLSIASLCLHRPQLAVPLHVNFSRLLI